MSHCLWPHGLYSPWNSPGQNTEVGSLSLLQVIFPTQGLNPGFLLCRRILYQLSHKGIVCVRNWPILFFEGLSDSPRLKKQLLSLLSVCMSHLPGHRDRSLLITYLSISVQKDGSSCLWVSSWVQGSSKLLISNNRSQHFRKAYCMPKTVIQILLLIYLPLTTML